MVRKYKNPPIIEALCEFQFGPDSSWDLAMPHSPLFLEVFTDSEAVNESQLVIFIATNLTPDKAVERLDQLDEDWWLDALEQSQGKLCINLEFR